MGAAGLASGSGKVIMQDINFGHSHLADGEVGESLDVSGISDASGGPEFMPGTLFSDEQHGSALRPSSFPPAPYGAWTEVVRRAAAK
jgi:hypothetical protein